MKVNLKSTAENFIRRVQNSKIEKKEAEIAKYVDVSGVRQIKVYRELYDAREVLANYAKANNVRIAMQSFPEGKAQNQSEKLISLVVSDKKGLKINLVDISPETSVKKTQKDIMLTNKETGVEELHTGWNSYEDTFLRRVYRIVQQMVEGIY